MWELNGEVDSIKEVHHVEVVAVFLKEGGDIRSRERRSEGLECGADSVVGTCRVIGTEDGVVESGEGEKPFTIEGELVVEPLEDMGQPVDIGGHGEEVSFVSEKLASVDGVVVGVTDEVGWSGGKCSTDVSHQGGGGDSVFRDTDENMVDEGAEDVSTHTTSSEETEVSPRMWLVGVEVVGRRLASKVALELIHVELSPWVNIELVVPVEDLKESSYREDSMAMDMLPSSTRHHVRVTVTRGPVVRLMLALVEAHTEVYTEVVLELKDGDCPHAKSLQVHIYPLTKTVPPVGGEEEEEHSKRRGQDGDPVCCCVSSVVTTIYNNVSEVHISIFDQPVSVLELPVLFALVDIP